MIVGKLPVGPSRGGPRVSLNAVERNPEVCQSYSNIR